ncbi:UNVERIFIED_CONTAM: Retrovirus-related Pol polyprotein from transposon RE1 [Sesamum radiatum]|uniref:Retrovirus-related Pol polyprotein from transposon RE1 n=1 Tax=Sesamum radiatum TaxID=300843 RepID=A0AAW2L8C7_SESRA
MQAKGQVEWENAMQQEIASLEKNATWEVVDLPKYKKAIGNCCCEAVLGPEFTLKDLGHAKYFLGLEIAHSIDAHTPLPLGLKLSSQNSPPLLDPELYRRLGGRLLYLGFTRPDISFGAQQLSQFVYRPCQTHLDAALHLLSYLLQDSKIDLPTPIPLYCDNQAAVQIVANSVFHVRTKHIEIDCHLVRDKFKAGFVLPSHIPSKSQLVDIFTKSLPASVFRSVLPKLGLVALPKSSLRGA